MQELELTQQQKSFMDRLGRLGGRSAAMSLSQILERKVNIKFTDITFLPKEEIQYLLGDPGIVVTGIYHELQNDLEGSLLTIIPVDLAKQQLSYMLKTEVDDEILSTHMGQSSLGELSNILCGSYISTISNLLEMKVIPSTPHVIIDMMGAITEDIILKLKLGTVYVLAIKTDLLIGTSIINLNLLLLLEHDSLDTFIEKINSKIGN